MKWNNVALIVKVSVSTLLARFLVPQLNVQWAHDHPLLSVIILPFLFIVWELWGRLKPRWLDAIADIVDGSVRNVIGASISRYRQKYMRHVADECRHFDVKGLSTQGTYALLLQDVFVELLVSSELTTPPGPIPSPSERPGQGSDIWQYLEAGGRVDNFLIVGRPGSGKTTLLRHISLMLAQGGNARSGRIPRKLPILLPLRSLAADVQRKPDLSLTEVVDKSKWFREMGEPIPIRWFEQQFQRGRFLILLDGLDEVADPDTREMVEAWLERQMQIYSRNSFIVTSRPRAFVQRIPGVNRLIIQPFSLEQVRQFVENWYMANELAGLDRNSLAARERARRDAHDLLERITSSEVLKELAVNPLLLTMIATIHRYRGKLPERRVELYREIWEVFLSRRDSIPHQNGLAPDHKRCVLEPLAHFMMVERTQEVDAAQVRRILKDGLKRVGWEANAETFLAMIEESSGLLLKKENGKYEFAHKTFQEYLSAVYSCKRGVDLANRVGDDWWLGTIRLNVAQSDGTSVCAACLRKIHAGEATQGIVELAKACLKEALQLDPQIRAELQTAVAYSALSQEPQRPGAEVLSGPTKPPSRYRQAWPTALAASIGMGIILLLPPTPLRRINYVVVTTADIKVMEAMKRAFENNIRSAHVDLGDTSYERLPLDRNDQWEQDLAYKDIVTQLKSFPPKDANYIIAIGTQACQGTKKTLGAMLSEYRLICIGVTAPIASGVISKPTNRNGEDQNIGVVAYLQSPESYVQEIERILPGFTIHYVYQAGIPQNDAIAASLTKNMPKVVITPLNHELSVDDFPDNPGVVYFSWFPFERMKITRVYRERIFIITSSNQDDVTEEGLAAIALGPDLNELGEKAATMLKEDFKGKQPLGKADMGVPAHLHYWINCKSAERLRLKLSEEIIAKAAKRFQCQ